ncbi:hypothetical protein BX592_12460 [Paraburkholderia rhizosphaerae]|uniref:Lipoprotein n=1 Tax=Paraburkholderia rhizosphaerae TaxID=480658 RepID=A0A4R8LCC9_9BURK|nr:hypothetical protein BX592_12460 [Paraburkholderia rhizosphaerae]
MKRSLKLALTCGTVTGICVTCTVFAQNSADGASSVGNAQGAATAEMTYHGDSSSSSRNAVSSKGQSSASGYGGVSGGTSSSGSLSGPGWAACGHLPRCNPDSGH